MQATDHKLERAKRKERRKTEQDESFLYRINKDGLGKESKNDPNI
jgi:hypothetical protein